MAAILGTALARQVLAGEVLLTQGGEEKANQQKKG
jgi:hypothetical protein